MVNMRTSFTIVAVFVLALVFAARAADAAEAGAGGERLQQAADAYARGNYESAIALWRDVEKSSRATPSIRLQAAIGIATVCQQMGLYEEGLRSLRDARVWIDAANDAVLTTQYEQRLGNLLLANHQPAEALRELSTAAMQAGARPDLQAGVLNDLGNALAIAGRATEALSTQQHALAIAQDHQFDALTVSTSLNVARLQIRTRDLAAARSTLALTAAALDAQPPSFERAMGYISLADLDTQAATPSSNEIRDHWLEQARQYAQETHNDRLLSLASGFRGMNLMSRGELPAAQEQFRQAVFFAGQVRADDLGYRWHWRLAQLALREDRLTDAIGEFDAALTALTPIRHELLNGYRSSDDFFQHEIRPLYLEFADALLRSADATTEEGKRQQTLERARNTIELLKNAEVQDYFRDECMLAQEAHSVPVDQASQDAAVLYPMLLGDRLELLVQIRGRLIRQTVPVDQAVVMENALRLRELIQEPDNTRFLPYAQRLYRWLIAPIAPLLQQSHIATLVIVPDGPLRMVPFAVLHDGGDYLVHDYAIAVTPGLTLTAAQPLSSGRQLTLLTGVSQPVQGFAPLPQVTDELASIHRHVDGEVLIDRQYTTAKLAAALNDREYAIVHMATHSVVGETPADSYLLTYDGKVTMTELEQMLSRGRFRKQPVELLTLSACETAVGDQRAALGFAGIALKSGARSAVATLWRVQDEASARLMGRFYEELTSAKHPSKAQALRAAQLAVLDEADTAHPANWAAFILIGNWL
jgi:CHAT domain-containing protein